MLTRLAIYAVIAVLLAGLGWKVYHDVEQHGYDRRIGEEQAQTIRDLRQNEIRSGNLQAEIDKGKKEKDDEIRDISARLADATRKLRDRPEQRLDVSAPAGTCPGTAGTGPAGLDGRVPQGQPSPGATGAHLAKPDAAWLLEYSANAKRLRAALKECYGALDRFRAAQPQGSGDVAPAQQ